MAGVDRDRGTPLGAVAERIAVLLRASADAPLAPALYLVATPIGNLGDITLRALSVLAQADVVRCEDTRHTGVLLSHFGIRVRARPYHEHNAAAERPRVLADLAAGKSVALVSDAGTPLISDPGYKLVRDALDAGFRVESVPGPSAAIAALACSGLPTDAFFFAGFLPARTAARRARIAELAHIPGTLVFFEAPSRVAETLADLGLGLGRRRAVIARELTKVHEEVLSGLLDELAARMAARDLKGEVVILVGPPETVAIGDEMITRRLASTLDTMTVRDAAKHVSDELGVPRARVYALALSLKREDSP